MGECLTAGRSTQQDGVGSSGCPQCELIQSDALSASGDNTLASILSEGDGTNAHLGAFKHTDIIGDLSNDNGSLIRLIRHVFGKTVESNGRCVGFGHVQTLGDGGAEFGVRSAGEEFVEFDQETRVGILCLDHLHGGFVAGTAAASFEVDSHGELVFLTWERGGEKRQTVSRLLICSSMKERNHTESPGLQQRERS